MKTHFEMYLDYNGLGAEAGNWADNKHKSSIDLEAEREGAALRSMNKADKKSGFSRTNRFRQRSNYSESKFNQLFKD